MFYFLLKNQVNVTSFPAFMDQIDISHLCEIKFHCLNTYLGSLMPYPVRLLQFELNIYFFVWPGQGACALVSISYIYLEGNRAHVLPSPQEPEGRK